MGKSIKSVLASLATAAAMSIGTSAQAADFSYNYIEGGYVFDADAGVDGDGFRFRGSVEIAPSIILLGELVKLDFDNGGDIDLIMGGAGYVIRYDPTFDLVGTFELGKADISGPGGNADETGFRIGLGGRARLAPNAHGFGRFVLENFDSSDTYFEIGGLFDVTPQFSVGASLQFGGDLDMLTINGRFNF
jgi:hypothetical protein